MEIVKHKTSELTVGQEQMMMVMWFLIHG